MACVADVIAVLEELYPSRRAEPWDQVGLVCGDPARDVRRIVVAVDPVQAVVDEAIALGADMVITHHPLFLKGTSSVAATTPKGRVVHDLIRNDIALFAAHTNADSPPNGVSESIAQALGLRQIRPLDPDDDSPLDKMVTFVPIESAESVREALTEAGAGHIGNYDSASFSTPGTGRFRPLRGASPAIGAVGEVAEVDEVRIEVVVPRSRRHDVVEAMRHAHPYEEPAFDLVELIGLPSADVGSGRIGELFAPMTLSDFASVVKRVLPATAHGVRVAGKPDQMVQRVALCGGAGDSFLELARMSGADVYITSDLRHHVASELREHDSMALIDVAHWAAESMWLPVLQVRLTQALGTTVGIAISTINTDPWTFRV